MQIEELQRNAGTETQKMQKTLEMYKQDRETKAAENEKLSAQLAESQKQLQQLQQKTEELKLAYGELQRVRSQVTITLANLSCRKPQMLQLLRSS